MTSMSLAKVPRFLMMVGLACLLGPSWSAAQEEPNEALIDMVVELLNDADRDMRALGLQQIREEVPGEAATKRFAALLPGLSPERQAALLEALGDRGDAAARPAVLKMLESGEEAVRAAALKALGPLGSPADVPLLSTQTAGGSKLESEAARESLVRLRGDGVNAAIVSAYGESRPEVQAELLGVLAARNAKETLPTVLESVNHAEPAVRLAALEALRFLADETQTATVVDVLKAAKNDEEREKALLALLAVCTRGREKCVEALTAGLDDADAPSRVALLRALARAGGSRALRVVADHLDDEDEAVRTEALRMLAIWPDAAAAEHLLRVAESTQRLRERVLAIRGLVRLAGPHEDKPADLQMLARAMDFASRVQEKRLVLGAVGNLAGPEALELAAAALDDPALAEEAALAAVKIAERIEGGDKGKIRAVVEKAGRLAKSPQIRDRAQKVLKSL